MDLHSFVEEMQAFGLSWRAASGPKRRGLIPRCSESDKRGIQPYIFLHPFPKALGGPSGGEYDIAHVMELNGVGA